MKKGVGVVSKFDKAVEFYLRGFGSTYIKQRTGISMQSLLKQLRAQGVTYTKDDIMAHQVAYITARYERTDIEAAYFAEMSRHDDPYKASRGRRVTMLGCGFGDYAKVLRRIIGDDGYAEIRNTAWSKKQRETMQERYGVTNAFEKEVFSGFASDEAIQAGRVKRTATMLERYGVEHPNQNPAIRDKMMVARDATNLERYGSVNAMQNPTVAAKSADVRQRVMLQRYGRKNSVEVKAIRDKIFDARKKNKTLNTSNAEQALGVMLREKFGEADVLHNVVVDERYPYRVDYYIKSLDLFIELNGDKCHNDHWFDPCSKRDAQIVRAWTENAERLERDGQVRSRYRKYIRTWTVTDVAKRQSAHDNDLNYLVFWDGGTKQRNKRRIATLMDAHDWFEAGCPSPRDWRVENTY